MPRTPATIALTQPTVMLSPITAEKVKHKQHDKAQSGVQQQLECPFYRRCEDLDHKPQQQTSDNDIDRKI